MINILVQLRSPLFTEDSRDIVDAALKDLPFGGRVFIQNVSRESSPFTEKQWEEQLRSNYGEQNKTLTVHSAERVEYHEIYEEDRESSVETFEALNEILLHGDYNAKTLPEPTKDWVERWVEDHKDLLSYVLTLQL